MLTGRDVVALPNRKAGSHFSWKRSDWEFAHASRRLHLVFEHRQGGVWPRFDEYVAQALVNKGARLAAMRRTDLALAAYDEVNTRFGNARDEVKRRLVAMAMRNCVVTLRDAGRTRDAADRMLAAFGTSSDKAITEHAGFVRKIRDGL